jgi:hypothetical protein
MRTIQAVHYGGTSLGRFTRRTPVALMETERNLFGERTGTYFVHADLYDGAERHRIGEVGCDAEGWGAWSGDRRDADEPFEFLGRHESREKALRALLPRWVRLPYKTDHIQVLKEGE